MDKSIILYMLNSIVRNKSGMDIQDAHNIIDELASEGDISMDDAIRLHSEVDDMATHYSR